MFFLKFLWRKWLPIARAIGNFQAQLTLAIFYIIIFFPVAVLFKLFADPLRLKKRRFQSNFQGWEYTDQGLEKARKQY